MPELKAFYTQNLIEAGCDEAGRGCLAGPVFAAAVILSKTFNNNLLDDSKKLSEKNRYYLRDIIQNEAVSWAVASVDNFEIDKINILNASISAMHLAIKKLQIIPEFLIIDGNRFKKFEDINHQTIIKGDGKFFSIAAASVLAKTYRDDFMLEIHQKYPQYNWLKNKGYPTLEHRIAVQNFGQTEYHRKSFMKNHFQTKIEF